MTGRYRAARVRNKRGNEESFLTSRNNSQPDPPPSGTSSFISKKRSTYGLQRDYRVLEREKKVSSALENEGFRSKLESILQGQLEGHTTKPSLPPPPNQWLDDLNSRSLNQGVQRSQQPRRFHGEAAAIIPINDLQGILASKYTVAEKGTRCKLAAVYRLASMFGWNQLIFNHITARAPGGEGSYLVNAYGLMYREVTSSNLIRADFEGNISDPGSTQFGVNRSGVAFHSAIYKARRDVKCVIHLSHTAGIAVSSMNCGILQISKEAVAIGDVSYLDNWTLRGDDLDYEMAMALSTNKVLVLHHHGVVAMGGTIEEAFTVAHNLAKACEIQVATISAGIDNARKVPKSVWDNCKKPSILHTETGWKEGELEFEALMRMLDSMGYRTGYDFKGLDLLQPASRTKKDTDNKNGASEILNSLNDKPVAESEKSMWEFLEKRPKVPTARLRPSRDKEPTISKETESAHNQDEENLKEDKLSSLKVTAERVARSTGDTIQKLTQEKEVDNPLGIVQQTAERVAKSTGSVIHKLARDMMEENNPLGVAQREAERVAKSTGDAVERLASRQTNRNIKNSHDPDLPFPETQEVSFVESSPPLSPPLSPPRNDSLRYTAQRVARSTGKSLGKVSSEKRQRAIEKRNESNREGNHKIKAINGQFPLRDNIKADGLSNGYHHHSPSLRKQKTRRKSRWLEMANTSGSSDSEYSTTESITEFPAEKQKPTHNQVGDLDINPLERMTDTAGIVAESTGKAVLKLTTTLPEF